MLEIGVLHGHSARMWKNYFERGFIYGVDIDLGCLRHVEERIEIFIGKQGDTAFLSEVLSKMGTPDIIIDDGSHMMVDQKITFQFLFPLLAAKGIYVIEDLHTSYWRCYGGGLLRPNTTIEMLKALIDGLTWWAYRMDTRCDAADKEAAEATAMEKMVKAVHFYDSICFIEKT